jgi:hypothetical protein
MATIHELATRMNAFVSNIDSNIEAAVMNVEDDVLTLNRKQMLSSFGNDDRPLIHSRTGKASLSQAYAKKTGKSKPNIFVNGNYQNGMFLDILDGLSGYYVASWHELNRYLPDNYKNLLGIAPSNKTKAYAITNKAIAAKLKSEVFK